MVSRFILPDLSVTTTFIQKSKEHYDSCLGSKPCCTKAKTVTQMDTRTTSLKPGFHMIVAKDLSDRSDNDRGDRNVVAAIADLFFSHCSDPMETGLYRLHNQLALTIFGRREQGTIDFHKLFQIFQKLKVARNFSKRCSKSNQKLLFVSTVDQKMLAETKTFFGLMLKYSNCTTKVRFLSIFVQFYGVAK